MRLSNVFENGKFLGTNFELSFEKDGLCLQIYDDTRKKQIFGALSHITKIIPYDNVSMEVATYRKRRNALPDFLAVISLNCDEGPFDGEIELPLNHELLETAKKHGVKIDGEYRIYTVPPKREKPKKVFRLYKKSFLFYIFWVVFPLLLCVLAQKFAKENFMFLVPVTGVLTLLGAIFALISILAPPLFIVYKDYVQFIDKSPVSFIDKKMICKIESGETNGGKRIVLWTSIEYLELVYNQKLMDYLTKEFPDVDIINH